MAVEPFRGRPNTGNKGRGDEKNHSVDHSAGNDAGFAERMFLGISSRARPGRPV